MTTNTAVTCTVPVQNLRASPYLLAWGSSVYARVLAINLYGTSAPSASANGAVIITYPDAPTIPVEIYSDRSASTLGIMWTAGLANGGSPVIDYEISAAILPAAFVVLSSNNLLTSYKAIGLTSGSTYTFRVRARNSFGYSQYSPTMNLLAAFVPN
jgi:hypothetical protein